jgi:hypothetical protein
MPIQFGGDSTKNGFGDYNDAGTSSTPVTLPAGTWVSIPNDGAGAFTNLDFLPTGVTHLMDTSTGEFLLSELQLGDIVNIRNDFTITPSTNNQLVKLRYVLGATPSQYTLETTIGRLDSGSGVGYRFSLVPFLIYVGDANTRDNAVTLQIQTSGNSSLVNAGAVVGVTKR